jgi:hypothetical protein
MAIPRYPRYPVFRDINTEDPGALFGHSRNSLTLETRKLMCGMYSEKVAAYTEVHEKQCKWDIPDNVQIPSFCQVLFCEKVDPHAVLVQRYR